MPTRPGTRACLELNLRKLRALLKLQFKELHLVVVESLYLRGEEAKEAFFQMMNEWFTEFIRTNLAVQQPPLPAPQPVPDMPQGAEPVRIGKPLVDKIHKYGAEAFRATTEDDSERAEFWLENTIRIFLDQKKKEFLELKQGNMVVSEYEWEFVWLSKYAREWVPTEADMCKRFEE
ncbi:Protein MCM10 [Gossypium australe]|uniref:Protein MCM10 n=1 Tax=Gossypium australe TaxID=47621 RepID=A0A5B6WUL9_9ROSI|nr:Protein MCM10 [Gossypium australe]